MSAEDYQYIFKFCLFGDSGVGKSCFLSQYTKGVFMFEYNSTIGLEFESKSIELNEGVVIQNQMWDASGNQKFVNIQISLCKNSTAALFFYKINNRQSFLSLEAWIKQLKDVCSNELQIVIIGTHKDLENQREVTIDEARKFAESYNAKIYEISNHDKDRVDGIVNSLTYNILRLINQGTINPTDQKYGIKLSAEQEKKFQQQQQEQENNLQQQSPTRRLSERLTNLQNSSPRQSQSTPQRTGIQSPNFDSDRKPQNQQQNSCEHPQINWLYIWPIILILAFVLFKSLS